MATIAVMIRDKNGYQGVLVKTNSAKVLVKRELIKSERKKNFKLFSVNNNNL